MSRIGVRRSGLKSLYTAAIGGLAALGNWCGTFCNDHSWKLSRALFLVPYDDRVAIVQPCTK